MRRILFILILLVNTFPAFTQDVNISSRLDTTQGFIGHKFRLTIKVRQPASASVMWPIMLDSIGHLEILGVSPVDTLPSSDPALKILSRNIDLTAYDSGTYQIPSLQFRTRKPGQDESLVNTDPLAVKIIMVKVDTTKDVRDIADIENVPYDWTKIILISLAVILLIGAGWFIYKKYFRNRKAIPVETKIILPPHIIALEAFNELAAKKLWQQGRIKLYHSELTDILRRYLYHRWGINAPEYTTGEILNSSSIQALPKEKSELLLFVLRLADLVKFARHSPLQQENEKSMDEARRFVELTKQESNPVAGFNTEEVKA